MRFRTALLRATLLSVAAVVMIGCRSGGTSYQVKWAKKGESIVRSEAPADADRKAPPIQQTSADPDESAADIDFGDDAGTERKSRWGALFSRHDKPKRVQLPRTDLVEEEEPSAIDSFGQF